MVTVRESRGRVIVEDKGVSDSGFVYNRGEGDAIGLEANDFGFLLQILCASRQQGGPEE